MADIDKGLPNIKRPEDEVVTENFAEVDVAEELGKGPVEVTEDEMGATIDFDPNQVDIPEGGDHFANLNDFSLDEGCPPKCGFLSAQKEKPII